MIRALLRACSFCLGGLMAYWRESMAADSDRPRSRHPRGFVTRLPSSSLLLRLWSWGKSPQGHRLGLWNGEPWSQSHAAWEKRSFGLSCVTPSSLSVCSGVRRSRGLCQPRTSHSEAAELALGAPAQRQPLSAPPDRHPASPAQQGHDGRSESELC